MAMACAVTCAFGLAACNNDGEKKPEGIIASSATAEEVSLAKTVSGWKLTDSDTSGDIVRYCIDLYIYNDRIETYGNFDLDNTDFTLGFGFVSAESIVKVGESYNGNNSDHNGYNGYLIDNSRNFYVKSSSQKSGDATEGYTVTYTTKYSPIKGYVAESRARKYIQRYALLFEEPFNQTEGQGLTDINYKGTEIQVKTQSDSFPSKQFLFENDGLQIFVTSKKPYKVTYRNSTYNYKTPYEKDHSGNAGYSIQLNGLNFDAYFNKMQSFPGGFGFDDFSVKIGGKTYTAKGFYDGKKSKTTNVSNVSDEYSERENWHDLTANVEEVTLKTVISYNDMKGTMTLYFDDIETKPESFTVYYKNEEIKVG